MFTKDERVGASGALLARAVARAHPTSLCQLARPDRFAGHVLLLDEGQELALELVEKKPAKELVDAPVSALSGVSASDAELLARAFALRTIGDLGRNKYFVAAQQIVDIAGRGK